MDPFKCLELLCGQFQKLATKSKFTTASGGMGRSYNYKGKIFTKGAEALTGKKLPLEDVKINKDISPDNSDYYYLKVLDNGK